MIFNTIIITDDYIFTFGKYLGEELKDVIKYDPGYALWCHNNVNNFILSSKQLIEAEMNLDDLDSLLFDKEIEDAIYYDDMWGSDWS